MSRGRELKTAHEASGRHYPVPGTWIDNLVELDKMIMLCALCKHKFNPKARRYIAWSKRWLAVAKCDGCNTLDRNVYTYIPEAHYKLISPDYEPGRRGRWAS